MLPRILLKKKRKTVQPPQENFQLCDDELFVVLSFINYKDLHQNRTKLVSRQFNRTIKRMEEVVKQNISNLKKIDFDFYNDLLELFQTRDINRFYKYLFTRNTKCSYCEVTMSKYGMISCQDCGKWYCEINPYEYINCNTDNDYRRYPNCGNCVYKCPSCKKGLCFKCRSECIICQKHYCKKRCLIHISGSVFKKICKDCKKKISEL